MAIVSRGQVRPSVWWLTCGGCLAVAALVFGWRYNASNQFGTPGRVENASRAASPVANPVPSPALPERDPTSQVVNVAPTPDQLSPSPAQPAPTPQKNVQAASLAGELLPRYRELKQHLALVEAKRKEILERDPDLSNLNQTKMRQLVGPNAVIVLSQALDDPVYRGMIEDMLQDQHQLEQFNPLLKELAQISGTDAPVGEVHSAGELISSIQRAGPAMQTRRDTLYKKLGMNEEMAITVEDGVSTGLMSAMIEEYMKDAGWHLNSAAQTFSPP